MLRNLAAEQARYHMTDSDVAKAIGVSRSSYSEKKNNGKFSMLQCKQLCELFGCSFEYLFSTDPPTKTA